MVFVTELDLARARRDLLVAVVQIYKALGGGWNALDEPTPSSAETDRDSAGTGEMAMADHRQLRGSWRTWRSSSGMALSFDLIVQSVVSDRWRYQWVTGPATVIHLLFLAVMFGLARAGSGFRRAFILGAVLPDLRRSRQRLSP